MATLVTWPVTVLAFGRDFFMRTVGLTRPGGIATLVVVLTVLVFSAGTAVGQTANTKGSDTFDDVPAGHWADEAIGWAVDGGITSGVGEGRFDLEGTVDRAQILTFLYRTVNSLQGVPVGGQGTVGEDAGGQIVFSSDRNVSNDIFVMNAHGTNVRQLTRGGFFDQSPSWSPDGTQIAFSSGRGSTDGTLKVFVMAADGTNVRQLTTGAGSHSWPSWSPDGTQIAFTSRDVQTRTPRGFVIDADGSNQRELTSNLGPVSYPGWSPDGTQILYSSDQDGDWEIFVMDADGTNGRQLTNNTHFDFGSGWSPDGTQIGFASDQDGDFEIFVMDADGTNGRQLTDNTHSDSNPVWSADGTQITFLSDRDGDFEIFVMDADGTNGRQLTNNQARDNIAGAQAWSAQEPKNGSDLFDDVPAGHWADEAIGWAVANGIIVAEGGSSFDLDGTVSRAEIVTFLHRMVGFLQGDTGPTVTGAEGTIAFHSDRDSDSDFEIFIVGADGTDVRQLTHNTDFDADASWSPDGTQIAFASYRDGDWEIFVMNSDGTNQRQLTHNTHSDWGPVWSPDGTQIAFTSDRGSGWQVFLVSPDGTGERQLTSGHSNGHPTWSPDGTQIAFESRRGGESEIFAMNADGTGERQLTSNTHRDRYPSWSPDGTQIAYTSLRNDLLEVFVMNVDGTNQRQLTSGTNNTWGVSWSPDGTQIVYNSDLGVSHLFIANSDGSNPQQLTYDVHHTTVLSQAWSSRTVGRGSDLFDDVPAGHEADRSIGWAFTNGITAGIGEGQFGPDGTVDRAQIVTFLYRINNLLGNN